MVAKQTDLQKIALIMSPKNSKIQVCPEKDWNSYQEVTRKYFLANYSDETDFTKKKTTEKNQNEGKKGTPFYIKFYRNPSQIPLDQRSSNEIKPESELKQETITRLNQEFQNYIKSSFLNIEEEENLSISQWWNSRRLLYPNLFRMAMDIFSAQPTSVQSERLFSKAGIFLGKDRGKMLKENLRRSFCVSEWMKSEIKF